MVIIRRLPEKIHFRIPLAFSKLWALLSPSQALFATLYSFQGKLASRDNNLAFLAHPLLYLPETLSFFFPFSSAFLTYFINSFTVTHREGAFYCSHHWHWPGSWFIICDTGEKHAHTNLYSWSSHLYSPNRYDTIDLTYPGSSRALSFGNIFFSIVRKKNSIWEEKNIPIKLKQIIQRRMKEEGVAKQCLSSQT